MEQTILGGAEFPLLKVKFKQKAECPSVRDAGAAIPPFVRGLG